MSRKQLIALLIFSATVTGFYHYALKKRLDPVELNQYSEWIGKEEKWIGKVAPDFELPLQGGGTFSLSETVGHKVIVINFFATWCEPCREEMPELDRFYTTYKEKGMAMVGVDNDETIEKVHALILKTGIHFPVGIDTEENIGKKYGVVTFPTTVIIGPNGQILTRVEGAITNADVTLEPVISSTLMTLSRGETITKEQYLEQEAAQDYRDVLPGTHRRQDRKSNELTGRAFQIAEKMKCPCGCSHSVAECSCNTAQDIRARLKTLTIENKTDEQVMKELNQEFCMGGM